MNPTIEQIARSHSFTLDERDRILAALNEATAPLQRENLALKGEVDGLRLTFESWQSHASLVADVLGLSPEQWGYDTDFIPHIKQLQHRLAQAEQDTKRLVRLLERAANVLDHAGLSFIDQPTNQWQVCRNVAKELHEVVNSAMKETKS